MARYYHAVKGATLELNLAGGVVIDKIAIGIKGFDKLGLPGSASEKQTKELSSRIRKIINNTKDGSIIPDQKIPEHLREAYKNLFLKDMVTGGIIGGKRVDVMTPGIREWLKVVEHFFDRSGGLVEFT